MKRVNALQLRQSLGKVLNHLKREGQPVVVEKDRKPAAVLISLEDYRLRFVDRDADETRRAIAERFRSAKLTLPKAQTSLELIRSLRKGEA